MVSNLTKFVTYARHHGVRSALKTAVTRVLYSGPQPVKVAAARNGKTDFITHYQRILGQEHGNAGDLGHAAPNSIQWVIPNFGFGSGGHLNIFRFINMMARRGYQQRLVIVPPYDWNSVEDARKALAEWYGPLEAELVLGIDGFRPSEVTFATGWQTAYWVAKHRASRHRMYFVQDYEPYFSPVSSEYYFAEGTYRLGLKAITAGQWLSDKLSSEFGMECRAVSFGVDHERYRVQDVADPSENLNILFYSRHVTPRRLFEIGLLALAKVCREEPRAAVIFAGGDVGGVEVPFHHLNAGEMKLDDLPELYARCQLSLVLSGTNLSLLPLEVSACGCPVVMNDSPSTRWLLPENAAYYALPDPDALADAMLSALRDPEERAARAARAKAIADAASWEKEGDAFQRHLADLCGIEAG